jgi:ABC-type transport system substrate-binding protein
MKMRLRATVMILLTVVALVTAGCGGGAPAAQGPGGGATIPLLRYGTTYTFANIDEKIADSGATILWSENLLRLGPAGQIEPRLAQSWSQQSPTVYVYHLRHGVKFWDGDEMTSADVVNTLQWDQKPDSYVGTYLTNVASFTAPDKYTVVITLKHPDAGWAPMLATVGRVFEKKFEQEHGGAAGGYPDPPRDAANMVAGSYAKVPGGRNLASYDSPQVNALLAKADSIDDKAQRFALYGQVLKIVAEDVPYVMLYTHTDDMALSSRFTRPGYNTNATTSPWTLQIRPAS